MVQALMSVPISHVPSNLCKVILDPDVLLPYTAESTALSSHLSFYPSMFAYFIVLWIFIPISFLMSSLLTRSSSVKSAFSTMSSLLNAFYLCLVLVVRGSLRF